MHAARRYDAQKADVGLEERPVPCSHTSAIVVIRTGRGCRIHCLACEEIGPEKGDPAQAWLALKARHREYDDNFGESDGA